MLANKMHKYVGVKPERLRHRVSISKKHKRQQEDVL